MMSFSTPSLNIVKSLFYANEEKNEDFLKELDKETSRLIKSSIALKMI